MSDEVKILRAFRPGDIVFVECDQHLSADAAQRIDSHFKKALGGSDVRVVVLERGMRIVAAEERSELIG